MLHFEWDKQKSLLNYRKHKLSFESAVCVFEDPNMLNWLDGRYNYEEEIIRIISARKANKEEQAQYFCYQPKS